MFSNRGYRWKLAAVLAIIALMGAYAARRGDRINPALWRCIVEPQRWNDTTVWLPVARILSVGESQFEVAAGDVRIRVIGPAPAGVDALISLRGIFRAEGPRMEMLQVRVLPPDYQRRRVIMEVVSVVVALAVVANFLRHFAFRPKVLQLERAGE